SAAVPLNAQQAGTPPASSEPVIYLNQGWSQEDREWYYHFSQGSAFLSYEPIAKLLSSRRIGLVVIASTGFCKPALGDGVEGMVNWRLFDAPGLCAVSALSNSVASMAAARQRIAIR